MVGDGWNEVSDEGKTFLKELLHMDPKKRLTAEQALSHPWISSTQGPTLNKRLSSISGLAVIASKTKKKTMGNKNMVDPGRGAELDEEILGSDVEGGA